MRRQVSLWAARMDGRRWWRRRGGGIEKAVQSAPSISLRSGPPRLLWASGVVVLAAVLLVLTLVVRESPNSMAENTVMEWVRDWRAPGLAKFMSAVSTFTNTWPRVGLELAIVAVVALAGRRDRAAALALTGMAAIVVGVVADYTLGEIVARGRPIAESTAPSFPSAHTFRTTALLGFIAFLSFRHGFRPSLRVPLLVAIGAVIAAVGPSRVYVGAHWPADVIAGYIVGALILLVAIKVYGRCERALCQRMPLAGQPLSRPPPATDRRS